jgi:hypothetical protein
MIKISFNFLSLDIFKYQILYGIQSLLVDYLHLRLHFRCDKKKSYEKLVLAKEINYCIYLLLKGVKYCTLFFETKS